MMFIFKFSGLVLVLFVYSQAECGMLCLCSHGAAFRNNLQLPLLLTG
jgi:hypothetical protein